MLFNLEFDDNIAKKNSDMIPSNIQELFNQKDTIEAEITEQEKILTRVILMIV